VSISIAVNCGVQNPFKDLPERPGGYPADYWRSRAIDSQYPVAIVAAALDSPSQYTPQMIATSASATGNADAMLLFGWSQASAANATESAPIMAAALGHGGVPQRRQLPGPRNDVLPLGHLRRGYRSWLHGALYDRR